MFYVVEPYTERFLFSFFSLFSCDLHDRFYRILFWAGKGVADYEKVSSQTQGNRGGTRQSTGVPSLNTDMECGVPEMPRPWRQNPANIVQNRNNSMSSRDDENPVRHSSVPTHLQPKDIRQQSNAARKEGKNRRPSF